MLAYKVVNAASRFVYILSGDGVSFPPASGNADFARFLSEWESGAAVTDADGVTIPYSKALATNLTGS